MSYISHEDYKNLMSQFQKETPKGMLKEALDPVGKEDSDIDNDGDTDKTDKYLLKRRAAVGKAIGKGRMMKEDGVEEYGYADNYPGSWGYNEGEVKENVHGGDPIPSSDIKHLGKDTYSIKRPDRQVVNVSFDDYEIEDIVDPPYGAIGTVIGFDEDGNEYRMEANFVAAGYDDWEKEPDHGSLEVYMKSPNNEGLHMPPLQATGPTVSTVEEDHMDTPFKLPKRTDTANLDYDPDASRFEPDYMKTPGEDDDDEEDSFEFDDEEDIITTTDDVTRNFKKAIAADKNRYPFLEENTVANPPYGFDVLSPDERKQLKEYIDSIKTIKKEIARLAAKAGKKIKEGGDTTGLVMTPSTVSEAKMDPEMYDRIEGLLDTKLHDTFEKVTGMIVKDLIADGFDEADIAQYLKYEIEKKAQEAMMGQHDLEERSYKVSKNAVPAYTLKAGDIITSGEEVVNVSAGAMTPGGKVEVTLKNPVTGKTRGAVWGKHTMIGKRPKAE